MSIKQIHLKQVGTRVLLIRRNVPITGGTVETLLPVVVITTYGRVLTGDMNMDIIMESSIN
jgi:hypothetical protein